MGVRISRNIVDSPLDVEITRVDCIYVGAAIEFRVRFRENKIALSPAVVFLLTIPRRYLCYSSSLFVRLWFNMWRLFCPYLLLISFSFGASGRLYCVIAVLPGFLHLYI